MNRSPQANYWEQLYRTPEYVYGTDPNVYLRRQVSALKPGPKALALGDGEGRNGVWMAGQGLDVVSVEISENAILKARNLARQRRLSLRFELCDLDQWQWPRLEFDLAAAIYVQFPESQRKRIHARLCDGLRPGAFLILEGFHQRHAQRMGLPSGLQHSFYTAAILQEDFCQFEIVDLSEETADLDEGPMHQGRTEIVRLTARKPTH